MTDAQETPDRTSTESDWERKRRLAAIFGDVLPEQTSDDRDPDSSETRDSEAWLKSQVPPHHG